MRMRSMMKRRSKEGHEPIDEVDED